MKPIFSSIFDRGWDMEKVDIEKMLLAGATVSIKPIGSSMCPLFAPDRDRAVVAPIESNTVFHRGDVIVYRRRSENKLVIHRIWRVKKDGLYLIGDNQTEIEGPVSTSDVKGIMIAMVRKGRNISVHNLLYVLYTRLWLLLRPVRPTIMGVLNRVRDRRKQKNGL